MITVRAWVHRRSQNEGRRKGDDLTSDVHQSTEGILRPARTGKLSIPRRAGLAELGSHVCFRRVVGTFSVGCTGFT